MLQRLFQAIPTCLLPLLLLSACRQDTAAPELPPSSLHVRSLRHQPAVDSTFWMADQLQWHGYYQLSIDSLQAMDPRRLPDDDARAYRHLQLAYNLIQFYRFAAAEAQLDSARRLTSAQHPATLADQHFYDGLWLNRQDRHSEALPHLLRADSLYRTLYAEPHRRLAESAVEIGFAYRYGSVRIDSCFHYFDRAYDLSANHRELADNNPRIPLGAAISELLSRDYIGGLALVDNATVLVKERPHQDTLLLAQCLNARGNMLKKIKRYEDADGAFRQAISTAESTAEGSYPVQEFYSDWLINILRLGDTILYMQELERGELRFAADGFRRFCPERLRGWYYSWQDQWEQCIPHYEQVLDKHLGEQDYDPLLIQEAFYLLNEAYEYTGQFEKGAQNVLQAMAYEARLAVKTPDWATVTNSLRGESRIFVYYEQLASLYRKAFEAEPRREDLLHRAFQLHRLIDTLLFNDLPSSDEESIIEFLEPVGYPAFSNALAVVYHLYELRQNKMYLEWALRFAERNKNALLFAEMYDIDPELPAGLRSLLQQDRHLRASIRAAKADLKAGRVAQASAALQPLLAQEKRLTEQIKKAFPHYQIARFNEELPGLTYWQALAGRNNAALLQYHLAPDAVYVIGIHERDVQLFRLPHHDSLAITTAAFRQALIQPRESLLHPAKYIESATDLYDQLLAPMESWFKSTKRLVIIPHGELAQLPFEALLTEEPAGKPTDFQNLPYFVRHHEIQYASSLKAYQLSAEPQPLLHAHSKVLGYAFGANLTTAEDHLYVLRSGEQTEHAPVGVAELNYIQALYSNPGSRFRYGPQSSIQDFLQESGKNYNIIHLGLHAHADAANKFDNYIVFPPPSAQDTAVRLYGYEIARLKLAPELLVLSACSTAYGPTLLGEGSFTLMRAFQAAGVRHIIATLWNVEDVATVALMSNLYDYLGNGGSYLTALHRARLDYLTKARGIRAHPYFWSGVVGY